ncbi:MAG: transglutaminase family protein [Chlamydia sp.]
MKKIVQILSLFFSFQIAPLYSTLPSLANQLIDTSSLFDLFRYALTFQNRDEGNRLLEEAIQLFIQEIDPDQAASYWKELEYNSKDGVKQLFLQAIEALIEEKTLFHEKTAATPQLVQKSSWNHYLTITKKIENRSLGLFKTTSKYNPAIFLSSHDRIDLARALAIEMENESQPYSVTEVALDILAVDVMRKKRVASSNESAIDLFNELLFTNLRIRFPPNAQSDQEIDQFSDIHEIMLSKRGVCLGVSSMYVALLQRIGIPYTIYTPPGHIFISTKDEYHGQKYERIIETTARGIHIPLQRYLDSRIAFLLKRTTLEIVGMVLMNSAAKELQERRFQKATDLYRRAKLYTYHDRNTLSTFLSFALLANGEARESKKEALISITEEPISSYDGNPLAFDLVFSRLQQDGLELFIRANSLKEENFSEKIGLQEEIEKYLDKTPSNQWSISLAYLFIEMALTSGKTKKAFKTLKECHSQWLFTKKSFFMGVPQLILLAKISYEESNIPQAVSYAKEAFYLAEKKRNILDKRELVFIPKELKELLCALEYKSPGALDSEILF